jgi:hypothetical protein
VIQDPTAAIEVRLPVAGSTGLAGLAGHVPGPGTSLRITGTVGRAYGAPRLSASLVTWLGVASPPLPLRLSVAPTAALEWRLVQVNGRLVTIHKLGDRWRAEIIVGKVRIPVAGLAGSRISVGRLLAGRLVTIIGIVRRAYPSAIDQRFAIEPRSISDVAFEPGGPVHAAPAGGAGGGSGTPDPGYGPGVALPTSSTSLPAAAGSEALVDLRDLAAHRGQQVQVGGLVTALLGAAITIDDGTASGRLILAGEAAAYLDLVEIGDPIRVEGLVEVDAGGPYLLVSDPAGVVATGDPTAAAATTSPDPLLGAAGASAGPLGSNAPAVGGLVGQAISRGPGILPALPVAWVIVAVAMVVLGAGLTLGLALLHLRRGRRVVPLAAASGPYPPEPGADGEPG